MLVAVFWMLFYSVVGFEMGSGVEGIGEASVQSDSCSGGFHGHSPVESDLSLAAQAWLEPKKCLGGNWTMAGLWASNLGACMV